MPGRADHNAPLDLAAPAPLARPASMAHCNAASALATALGAVCLQVNPGWPAALAAGACLAALAPMRRLTSLRVDRLRSWAGVAALGGCLTRLRVLMAVRRSHLPMAGPFEVDLAGLAHLPRLRELDLDLRMAERLVAAPGDGGRLPPQLAWLARLRQLRHVRPCAPVSASMQIPQACTWLLPSPCSGMQHA